LNKNQQVLEKNLEKPAEKDEHIEVLEKQEVSPQVQTVII
jgi:hypothetical protein